MATGTHLGFHAQQLPFFKSVDRRPHIAQGKCFSSQNENITSCSARSHKLHIATGTNPQNLRINWKLNGGRRMALVAPHAVTGDSTGINTGGDTGAALDTATSFYPLYVVAGGILALFRPDAFSWFVSRGPTSYSLTLGAIMLAMGLTLQFDDLVNVIVRRPLAVLFGCAAQYGIMPLLGVFFSRLLSLPPDLAVGLILLSCCPGGTASNVVTYIAYGDVSLSVMMTVCATFGAVVMTPLLTSLLAGTTIPVDAAGLAGSTMQVVVLPVLLGAGLQKVFPVAIARLTPFSPLAAVLMSSLLACSVFSANIPLFMSSSTNDVLPAGSLPLLGRVVTGVVLVHAAGFALGYAASALGQFKEAERRAVSIEVGMQNSSLGVVLAARHFASPSAALPAAVSAVLMNIMGSSLAAIWRQMGPPDDPSENPPK